MLHKMWKLQILWQLYKCLLLTHFMGESIGSSQALTTDGTGTSHTQNMCGMHPAILGINEKYRKGNILDELKAQKAINGDLFHEPFTTLRSVGRTGNMTELS